MKYTGTSTRASCHVYCIKHEDFSCYKVFYITTTPYLPCKISRKELYDFYYMLVTLTQRDIRLHSDLHFTKLFYRIAGNFCVGQNIRGRTLEHKSFNYE